MGMSQRDALQYGARAGEGGLMGEERRSPLHLPVKSHIAEGTDMIRPRLNFLARREGSGVTAAAYLNEQWKVHWDMHFNKTIRGTRHAWF
jgi:hypothetical protein